MSKWDSELAKLASKDQIEAAKEKWKMQKVKLIKVYYEDDCLHFIILNKILNIQQALCFSKRKFKCLNGFSDEDIAQVELLGDRAIRWEKLDIDLGLDKLLDGIQLKCEWLEDLKSKS